ncbi:MAG TPA: NAD(P)H-dependent glycerol-3-phosphate dehydrogenase [Gammaproteobacteria bacterium]|nr:NAD(P)H-dependent glycerol-3-phosphate dehydrogenase [Gammaproteobacteria bacterium]
MQNNSSIAVLGAGSWGTALAILLARKGHRTALWGRDPRLISTLAQARCNTRYLPDVPFPDTLQVSSDLPQCLAQANNYLIAVPSHAFQVTLQHMRPYLDETKHIAWATKGLEPHSGKLLHQVAAETVGDARPPAVISGPTFAREVVRGSPTAVTVASESPELAQHWATLLHNDNFRVYTCTDVIGVEVGGAVKNVLAIAAGIADGLGLGANTRAALISRGLAEMMRLGVALGGKRETFVGLAGLGDLVLTCTDDLSRNRRLGLALARGESLETALTNIGQVVEGAQTVRQVVQLAETLGMDMPISQQVYQVLYGQSTPRAAVQALLNRDQKAEFF